MKFSQRYGYTPVREIIQFESIDDPLRNKLWNLLDFYVWSDANSYGEYSQDLLYLCKSLMFGYFNKPIDEINKLWWKERIKGGLATESQAVRASGSNPAEVKRRRRVEVEENRKFGLKFDTDLTNTGTTNAKTENNFSTGSDDSERDKDE